MKQYLILFLAICFLISPAIAAEQDTISEITASDAVLDASSMRIICLTAATCEILYAIGAGDGVIGRGEYCDYPEEILAKPELHSGDNTNIEQIIALSPDIVFMSTMAQSPEQVTALEELGFRVIATDAQTIEEIYDSIELIGAEVGRSEQAAEVTEEMKAAFHDVSEQAKSKITEEQTIYFEVSPLEWGLWTSGKNTFMNEIATMLGVKNIFEDIDGWAEISQEQIIDRDPDYIITVTMYYGAGPVPEEEIMGRSGWSGITAVQNEQVFYIDSDEISRPGPRLAEAAKDLYALIYEPYE